jgi:hypothetical protein
MLRWLKTIVVRDEERARVTDEAGIGQASGSDANGHEKFGVYGQ